MYEALLTLHGIDPYSLPSKLGPGPQTLLSGNGKDGYFGIVTGTQLGMTPQQVMTEHNLPTGSVGYNGNWLKFAIDRKIIYLAQLTAWFNVDWPTLNTAGLIAGRDIVIGGNTFQHRAISGDVNDPSDISVGAHTAGGFPQLDNSEWGRTLMQVASTSAGGTGKYMQITQAQLQWSQLEGNGSVTILRGRPAGATTQWRGIGGNLGAGYVYESAGPTKGMYGHRPMLILKQ